MPLSFRRTSVYTALAAFVPHDAPVPAVYAPAPVVLSIHAALAPAVYVLLSFRRILQFLCGIHHRQSERPF